MKYSMLGAVGACLSVMSLNAGAAVVNADWKIAGDNLLTHDNATGLYWLDLTETSNISRNDVLTQLGSGGDFEGFRYATSAEVVALWSNWNIDVSSTAAQYTPGLDPNVEVAATFLVNANQGPFGVTGVTGTQASWSNTTYHLVGAAHDPLYDRTSHLLVDDNGLATHFNASGHYLVQSSVVPVPAAIWLFGSGLLGLVGVARRKKA